ncbi:hypothetical protein LEP1GSC188_4937 [Leptospira weilii serovar Topaz str. LT2116]|uniref:Uncharacterized protein n=1 Tax=Leptospira weilii serovar Topaz str. LT2116 TaxID=1088540 RepID=M3FLS7_9LEPT|nr:hypothetical protein LEP1GSC188_4937 [Leptospira weilii serovar Topaz str. LT2116]
MKFILHKIILIFEYLFYRIRFLPIWVRKKGLCNSLRRS